MKVALQTICWGDRLKAKHRPDLLPAIKAAGYDGVEIFQAPSELPGYAELRQLCQRAGIRILGLSG
jgi:sugar phosphate isomerase/epimerase